MKITYAKEVLPAHPFDAMDGGKTGGTDRTLQVGWLQFNLRTHPTYGMGRFGGGWQWKVGLQASTGFRTVILELLVASLRITWEKKEEK